MVPIYCASLVCASIAVSRKHSVLLLPYIYSLKKLSCRARSPKCCLWIRAHVCVHVPAVSPKLTAASM